MSPRTYSSYAEFEREEIRPNFKIGFSLDDLEEAAFDHEVFDDIDSDEFLDEYDQNHRY
jgi:hypothetical protein